MKITHHCLVSLLSILLLSGFAFSHHISRKLQLSNTFTRFIKNIVEVSLK